MDDNHLESFLLFLIELLTSRNLLDEFLDDDFVMVVCLARRHLDMVVRREDNAFNGGRARSARLEFLQLAFDLVDR